MSCASSPQRSAERSRSAVTERVVVMLSEYGLREAKPVRSRIIATRSVKTVGILDCIAAREAPGNFALDDKMSPAMNPAPTARLDGWLSALVSRSGADLLLIADAPPCISLNGSVHSSRRARARRPGNRSRRTSRTLAASLAAISGVAHRRFVVPDRRPLPLSHQSSS